MPKLISSDVMSCKIRVFPYCLKLFACQEIHQKSIIPVTPSVEQRFTAQELVMTQKTTKNSQKSEIHAIHSLAIQKAHRNKKVRKQ